MEQIIKTQHPVRVSANSTYESTLEPPADLKACRACDRVVQILLHGFGLGQAGCKLFGILTGIFGLYSDVEYSSYLETKF